MTNALALVFLACAPAFADGGAMTPAERTYLLEQLESSRKEMLASIKGLTEAQWKFKSAPAVWSIQECAEHIILAEDYIFAGTQKMLQTPVIARPATSTEEADRKIVAMIKDRSKKATAPEPIVPTGKYATPADAAREFEARRQKTIEYVKTTKDELRVHSAEGPVGPMDSYQMLLLLAAHSSRHTAQILEVKANPGYAAMTKSMAAAR
ncbi:MAG: DinB family protein [Bryobacteraceae bacterium]